MSDTEIKMKKKIESIKYPLNVYKIEKVILVWAFLVQVVVTLITEGFLKIPQLSPHTKKPIYDIIEMLLKLTLKNDNSIWMTYTCIL